MLDIGFVLPASGALLQGDQIVNRAQRDRHIPDLTHGGTRERGINIQRMLDQHVYRRTGRSRCVQGKAIMCSSSIHCFLCFGSFSDSSGTGA